MALDGTMGRCIFVPLTEPGCCSRDSTHESQSDALEALAEAVSGHVDGMPVAVGHRIVHGGPELRKPSIITPQVLDQLRLRSALCSAAYSASFIADRFGRSPIFSSAVQFACFDDAFHQNPPRGRIPFRHPATLRGRGHSPLRFSRDFLRVQLVHHFGAPAPAASYLRSSGHGFKACVRFRNGMSIDTTMGLHSYGWYSHGPRGSGDLDPGVIIYLLRNRQTRFRRT